MNHHSAPTPGIGARISGEPHASISLPRVSVVVTCFNYGRFVGEALDSVAAQTYGNFKCAIVDDCSTDDSFETIERWISRRQDSRFTLIRNERNLGQMGSLAAGLAATEGEFFATLDADDVWFPDFLKHHIEVHIGRTQTAAASSSDLIQIDAEGHVIVGSTMPPVSGERGKPVLAPAIQGVDDRLLQQPSMEVRYIGPDFGRWHWSMMSGMLFRRPMVELLLPANADGLRLGADIYLIVLSHFLAGSFVIRNALGAYRRHGANNFSNLPVFGSPGGSSVAKTVQNLQSAYRAMLEHVLTVNEQLSLAFAPRAARKCAQALFRYFLLQGIVIDDPRLTAIVGRPRLICDRILARTGLLGRMLRKTAKRSSP